ncbi:MAG: YcbK family protein [Gemmobacter sp.]|jgi:uncharacterized protein YcbK (DUF882 family)
MVGDRVISAVNGFFGAGSDGPAIGRRALLGGLAAGLVGAALPSGVHAFSILSGRGNFRRIRMYSGRSGESIDTVYWIDGTYIPEAMEDINRIMRDVRTNQVRAIDPAVIDILAAAHGLMEVSEPYTLLSGYRTLATNNRIRESGGGAARNSLHIQGQAADVRLRSRSLRQMANAAKSCNSGGVGVYARSNFVHMDCGPVRVWTG